MKIYIAAASTDLDRVWHWTQRLRIAGHEVVCDQPNRVVVQHDRPRLVLHGARSLKVWR